MIPKWVFPTNNQTKHIAMKMDNDTDMLKPQQIVWVL